MNDIYDLLNDVKADTEELEVKKLSDAEVQRMKKNIRKTIEAKEGGYKMKKRKTMTVCIAACAAAICILSVPFSKTAYAKGLYYDIANFLGITMDLEPYKTVVNETKADKGISVTLKEVILDDDSMTIATLVSLDQSYGQADETFSPIENMAIFINGHAVGSGASGGSQYVDTNTFESVITYDVGSLGTENLDIELQYRSFLVEGEEIKGNWDFAFSSSQEELAAVTKHVAVDASFTLNNGCQIRLKECKVNAMGVKIDFTFSGGRAADYDLKLEGTDSLGNPVTFYLSRIWEGDGRFVLENMDNGNLDENADSLALTPYAREMPKESGRITGEYRAVGDPFTIQIH